MPIQHGRNKDGGVKNAGGQQAYETAPSASGLLRDEKPRCRLYLNSVKTLDITTHLGTNPVSHICVRVLFSPRRAIGKAQGNHAEVFDEYYPMLNTHPVIFFNFRCICVFSGCLHRLPFAQKARLGDCTFRRLLNQKKKHSLPGSTDQNAGRRC